MNKLLLIDGSHLLFQMFYGMPAKIYNASKENIEGVLGFIGGLINIITLNQPTHIALFFDSEEGSNRRELNPEYKQNRPTFENVADIDNPFARMDKIFSVLDTLRIQYQEVRGLETDDVIAGFALADYEDLEVVISSADSDYFQLINDRVTVFRYRGKKGINSIRYTNEKILADYHIEPKNFAEYKALVGDSADNIKGVKQIGAKTAANLIHTFGGLDEIYSRLDEVKSARIQENLRDSKELVYKNLEIIQLRKLEPIFKLDDLVYDYQNLLTANEVARAIKLFD